MTITALPLAADLDPPAPHRLTIVQPGDWPGHAALIGHADSEETSAAARAHWDLTGRQPENLPGYTPAPGEW